MVERYLHWLASSDIHELAHSLKPSPTIRAMFRLLRMRPHPNFGIEVANVKRIIRATSCPQRLSSLSPNQDR